MEVVSVSRVELGIVGHEATASKYAIIGDGPAFQDVSRPIFSLTYWFIG